jgi:hypothetical protein
MAKHRRAAVPDVAASPRARHVRVRPQSHGPVVSRQVPAVVPVATVSALLGAPLALVGAAGALAAVGTALLALAGTAAWLSVAVASVGMVRGSRRDSGAGEPAAVEEGTSTAAHRADRPRPRVPWYVGVEVSFEPV